MAKLFLYAVALMGLFGCVCSDPGMPSEAASQSSAGGAISNALNELGRGASGAQTPQMPQMPQLNQMPPMNQMNQMMPQMMNGDNQMMPGGGLRQAGPGGLGELLRSIPQRGMQMISNLMSGVRNMLPGGRGPMQQQQQQSRNPMDALNGNQQLNGGFQQPLMGLFGQQPQQHSSNGNMNRFGNSLPNPMDTLAPLTNSLSQQTGLPLDRMTNGIQQTLGSLTGGNSNQASQRS